MNPAKGKMTDDDHLFDDAPQGVGWRRLLWTLMIPSLTRRSLNRNGPPHIWPRL